MSQLEFEGDGAGKEYKVEAIWDSAVHPKEPEGGHSSGLYYLVSWKSYPKEENTWELASVIQHLRRLVSTYHKEHPEEPTTTSPQVDSALLMARPTIKPTNKRKRGRPAKATSANKRAKNSWGFDFYLIFGPVSSKAKHSLSIISYRSLFQVFLPKLLNQARRFFPLTAQRNFWG